MSDRADLLQRLRSRAALPERVLAEIDEALATPEVSVGDVLRDVGLDSAEIARLLDGDEDEEEQTILDEPPPRVTTMVRVDEPTVDDLIGRLVDVTARFEVQGEIAHGAMGRILAAWDLHLGRPVAIKVLRRTTVRDLDRVRFLEEAQVTGQLQHPNIVPVYELGRLHDQVAFVMRRVEGRSLKQVIGLLRRGRPDAARQFGRVRLLNIFHQVCLAVAFSHTRGVVHRDLKPSNVMIGDFGEVLLLDWGLCKVIGDATRSTRSTSDRWRTVHGQIIGTPAYMAPEQAMGLIDQVDARTDVYGLGAILYHLLTLRPPYVGRTNREIVQKVLRDPVPPPSVRAPDQDVPPRLAAVIMRCLARRPEERYPDARALADALAEYLEAPTAEAGQAEGRRLLQEGVAAISRQQSLLEDAAVVRDAIQTAGSEADPAAARRALWEAESRLRAIEIEIADAYGRAVSALTRAVARAPEEAEARRLLCELYAARHERAQGRGDEPSAAYYRRLIAEADDGTFARLVAGNGSLQVEVHPRGATVWLARLVERQRRLVESAPHELGPAPVVIENLPAGAYRLIVRALEHEPLSLSFLVPPGGGARLRLRLLRAGAVPEGFAHVPGGPFRFGVARGAFALPAEQALPDFLIARTPVTAGDYLRFLRALARKDPAEAAQRVPRGPDGVTPAWPHDAGGVRLPDDDAGREDLPVTGVTAGDAAAYCQWYSRESGVPTRLPTEEEWEKAARGTEGRAFPWGHRWEPSYAACAETWPGPHPPPVGHVAEDASPFGVRDLAGGVREWTSTLEPGPRARMVVRGGSFLDTVHGGRPLWVREIVPADRPAPDLGFRLARDVDF
jgi:serine/threonine-protein kinase